MALGWVLVLVLSVWIRALSVRVLVMMWWSLLSVGPIVAAWRAWLCGLCFDGLWFEFFCIHMILLGMG